MRFPSAEGRAREASQCGAGIGACGRGFTQAAAPGGRADAGRRRLSRAFGVLRTPPVLYYDRAVQAYLKAEGDDPLNG